jgi:hypothetical protein
MKGSTTMNKTRARLAGAVLPAMLVAACQDSRLTTTPTPDLSMPPHTTTLVVTPALHKDVDVLFLIDNSPGMVAKQKLLAQAIPGFMATLDAAAANYQIGIVTTDLGFNVPNGSATGTPFPPPVVPSCNTAAGDDGVLQNIPCSSRSSLSPEAQNDCNALCPNPTYVPANGARYISKINGVTNVPSRISAGMDIGPATAFQCMGITGDVGCGIEQPLEAVKRALDNHRPDNQGFNRGNSILAVIFLTDEDDCSVQLGQRAKLNPAVPNEAAASCTTPAGPSGVSPDCYNVDYRCIATDVSCSEPMNTVGKKTNCSERPDTIMNSLDQYVSFLNSLPNPQIVLAGIWSPTMLDNVMSDPTKDGQLYVDLVNAASGTARLNRGQVAGEAACFLPDPMMVYSPNAFYGRSQFRLSSFIRRFPPSSFIETSICDASHYGNAVSAISSMILSKAGVDCLRAAPLKNNGMPECTVGYVDAATPQAMPSTTLPVCSTGCCNYFATDPAPREAQDPNLMPNTHLQAEMAACSTDPDCYCAVPSTVNCSGGAVAGVWRAGNAAPPAGKVVSFSCTTM